MSPSNCGVGIGLQGKNRIGEKFSRSCHDFGISVWRHARNLYTFSFCKSFGLTDEGW